jgi:hypothetical protein
MTSSSSPGRNSDNWEIIAGPEQMVPWEEPDVSSAWVWSLRHRRAHELRELSVRVSWKGFDSIDEVPSRVTREAFASAGRSGVSWFMNHTFDAWAEIIFHSQSRLGPHGSTGRHDIIRLAPKS